MRRFYIPPEKMGNDKSVITGTDAHHLRDVLKLQAGDRIVIFDGTGRQYEAQITSVNRREVKVTRCTPVQAASEPAVQLTIAQGYLKDKKMDGVVRQLTELGVDRWVPFLSRRSVPTPGEQRLKGRYGRWRKISLEALKQCGRSRVMAIDPLTTFEGALRRARDYEMKIIFWEDSTTSFLADQVRRHSAVSVFLMVGPEGGFDPDEISLAQDEGFRRCSLGPRILRAETAAVVAAILGQFVFGDMG